MSPFRGNPKPGPLDPDIYLNAHRMTISRSVLNVSKLANMKNKMGIRKHKIVYFVLKNLVL